MVDRVGGQDQRIACRNVIATPYPCVRVVTKRTLEISLSSFRNPVVVIAQFEPSSGN